MDTAAAGFRLSPQQRRLWQLHPGGPPGVAQIAIEIEGEIDPGRLRRAAGALTARYDSLRTVHRRTAGFAQPLQVPLERAAPAWRTIDLAGVPEARRGAALAEVRRTERAAKRDLARPPVVALCLARGGPLTHCLVVTLPALAADLRSLGVVMRRLAEAYGAGGEPPADAAGDGLGDEVTQYLQFSEWQHQLLEEGGGPAGELAALAESAGGDPDLPLAHRRTAAGGGGRRPAAAVAVPFPAEVAAGIRALARRRGAPDAAALLAAWQTLLARLGGRREAAVAAPFDGRKYPELHDCCGLLSKWLPVRAEVHDGEGFGAQVTRAANALVEAASWQEYFVPAEGHPLAAAGFEAFAWPAAVSAASVRFSAAALRCEQETLTLVLQAAAGRRRADDLDLRLRFDPAVFDRAAATYLAERLGCLLAAAAAAPETPVATLDLLGAAERRRLAAQEAAPAAPAGPPEQLEALVSRHARRAPATLAAACGGEELSYRELAAGAAALAARLRRHGVGPDVLVPVCIGRSPQLLVAILGVLAAGGAYVPLDPGQPPARLARILAEVAPRVVLTADGEAGAWLPAGASSLAVDPAGGPAGPRDAAASEPLGAGAPLDCLAYVIYTSGSTGSPKGVMVSRRALANYLAWAAAHYRVAELGGAVAQSPAGFDLAVTSLLAPLAAGGRVVLAREAAGLEEMASQLAAAEVGLFKLTPSLAETALELLPAPLPPRRRVLVLGGEALSQRLAASWLRRDPGVRLLNEYGPTEATVGCAVHEADAGGTPDAGVPIGGPIDGMRLRLLDERLDRVPAGAAGELFLGGTGLARGYLGRPDLTAERFVPDPFLPGERLYRSGDRARRRLADGVLEFLGRADEQVKVRGWRVEPAEVAAAIERHPAVAAAAVVARQEAGGARLEAYFTALATPPADAELRDHLRRELPEHMVPAVLMALPALPLTANGKVDRAALLARAAPDRRRETVYVAPETDLESRLAAIWQEVLRVERVGVADNFFDLGGHSLLMVQVFSRIKAQVDTQLLMVELFEFPTVAGMARRLAAEMEGEERAPAEEVAGAARERAAARLAALPQAELREAARRELGDG